MRNFYDLEDEIDERQVCEDGEMAVRALGTLRLSAGFPAQLLREGATSTVTACLEEGQGPGVVPQVHQGPAPPH